MFGDIDLDFRQATMPPGEVVINAVAPFGNIDVLVPDGVQVDVGGFTLFGSKKIAVGDDHERVGGRDPGAGFQPLRERQGELVTGACGAGAASVGRSRWTGPPTSQHRWCHETTPFGHAGSSARLGDGVRPGGHLRCRIRCRPPGSVG